MKKITDLFKKLTAYDHFTVFLIILSVLKIADVFADEGMNAGIHFIKMGVALLIISTALFFAFKYLFDKRKKYQTALISTLLILLVLSHEDPDPVRGVLVIVLVYVAKFFVKYKQQNIFNPVVFAIGVGTLISMFIPSMKTPPLDWSGIDIRYEIFGTLVPVALLPIALSLYFNVGRIKKHPLALSFIITSILAGFVLTVYAHNPMNYILAIAFTGTAIIVEPKSSPFKKKEQIIFGIAIALLISILNLVQVSNAIILGLLMGNLGYFIFKIKMTGHQNNT